MSLKVVYKCTRKLHTMPGYCYLTPGWDISILRPPPPYCACANVILPYQTTFNLTSLFTSMTEYAAVDLRGLKRNASSK